MSIHALDPWDEPAVVETCGLTQQAADTMIADIHADLTEAPWEDPGLAQQLLSKAMRELANASVNGTGHLKEWAGQVLEAMWHRSRTKVEYGTPTELPAEPAYLETLDESERTGH